MIQGTLDPVEYVQKYLWKSGNRGVFCEQAPQRLLERLLADLRRELKKRGESPAR